jgi:hypothetical protein
MAEITTDNTLPRGKVSTGDGDIALWPKTQVRIALASTAEVSLRLDERRRQGA